MEKLICVICNSNSSTVIYNIESEFSEIYDIVKCSKCNFIYLNPKPSKNEMSKYYNNNYLPHLSLDNFYLKIFKKISYFWKIKQIKNYSDTKNNHIDIGGGNGSFSKYLNNNGYKSFSYDPFYTKNNSNISDIPSSSYQIATLWHSIEHMYDIDSMLNNIYRITDNDATIYIACPNYDSIDRMIFKKNWAALDVPRHLYHFTPKSIKNFLKKHNLEIIKIKSMPQDTIFNIFLSLKSDIFIFFKFLPLLIFSYFYNIFVSGSCSSYLYICKKK